MDSDKQNSIDNLEQKFHLEMLLVYENALKKCNYKAKIFKRMVEEHGGLEAAKRLLCTKEYSYGFTQLAINKRLDLSMEATIIKEPWKQLFSEEELSIARTKLEDWNFFD